MIPFGLVLLALGLCDLVAGGLAGQPSSGRRVLFGLGIGAGAVLLGTALAGLTAVDVTVVTAIFVVGTGAALLCRGWGSAAEPYPRLALTLMATMLLAVFALGPRWVEATIPALDAWLSSLPYPRLETTTSAHLLLLVGTALFLAATSNFVVRATLTLAGTDWRRSQERLRGGRVIGILERWLIFALALLGEPTAAALVVSAKSLLRFPELSQVARRDGETSAPPAADVDVVTEYFLLGSLLSWSLALLPALLFGGLFDGSA